MRIMPADAPPASLVEREYDNRAAVPGHLQFFARWEKDSAYARDTLEGARLDIPYGPDARHRIDYFPAKAPRGLLVFFHGGYWRTLDKRSFSWLAPAWVAEGITFAAVNYRLCPDVGIPDIVDDCRVALNAVAALQPGPIALCGHSAGGHLTAAMLATDPAAFTFEVARLAGGVAVSGIVDFAPLLAFSANAQLRLTEASALALSTAVARPAIAAPLVVAVGAQETSEFIRQSQLLADAWKPVVKAHLVLPGHHHFSVLDALAERTQPLHEATRSLFA